MSMAPVTTKVPLHGCSQVSYLRPSWCLRAILICMAGAATKARVTSRLELLRAILGSMVPLQLESNGGSGQC